MLRLPFLVLLHQHGPDQPAVFLLRDNIPYVAVANAPGGSTDPLPMVSFAAGSASTVEGGAPVDVLISLARPAARNVVVNLRSPARPGMGRITPGFQSG